MEPTLKYDYYKDKLQDIWTYEESFETFDEWWRVIKNFLEQAFQDGLNACPECIARKQRRLFRALDEGRCG